VTKPKRPVLAPCPKCKRRGIGEYKPVVTMGVFMGYIANCRYCQHPQRRKSEY
jgi:hypothetical protein